MSVENYSNIESVVATPQEIQERNDREFNSVLENLEEMPPKMCSDVIEALANKDPELKVMVDEIKCFYQERIMNLEEYDITLKLKEVEKFIKSIALDHSKRESITFEGNEDESNEIKTKFYRLGGDGELHSRYFTVGNIENQKLVEIKEEFSAWIERTRAYIDRKYKAVEVEKAEPEVKDEQDDKNIESEDNVEKTETAKYTDNILEKNEKYSFLTKYIDEVLVGDDKISILNLELQTALDRHNINKEPLKDLLGDKYTVFLDFLDSDKGKDIINDSNYFKNIKLVGEALQIDEIKENESGIMLASDVLVRLDGLRIKIDELVLNREKKKEEIDEQIADVIKKSNGYSVRGVDSEKIADQYFERELKEELKNYAKDILKLVLSSKGAISTIKAGESVSIPFAGEKITFDFSELPEVIDVENLTEENVSNIIDNNFDDIYIDGILERVGLNLEKLREYGANHPAKLGVDVVSIILSGLAAVGTSALFTTGTGFVGGAASVGIAGTTFTATDNIIRGFGYGMIAEYGWDSDSKKSFKEGALEGVGLDKENLTMGEGLTKKGFELASNIALFGVFKGVGAGMKYMGLSAPENASFFQKALIENQKSIPEAGFFTAYGIGAAGIEDAALSLQDERGYSMEEAYDLMIQNFGNFKDGDTVLHAFMYNLGFISLVKGMGLKWSGKAEAKILKTAQVIKENGFDVKALKYSNQMNKEILKLESEGFTLTKEGNDFAFYNRDLNKVDLMRDEFAEFRKIQEDMVSLTIQFEKLNRLKGDNPQNSGKGISAKNMRSAIDLRYLKLERLSKEAETKGLGFTLEKNGVVKGMKDLGFKEGAKDALLKEAGFSENDRTINRAKEYERGSENIKDRALERMNNAVNKIYEEAVVIDNVIFNEKKSNKKVISILMEHGFETKDQANNFFEILSVIK